MFDQSFNEASSAISFLPKDNDIILQRLFEFVSFVFLKGRECIIVTIIRNSDVLCIY